MKQTIAKPKKHLLREMYPYDIAGKKHADLRKGLKEYDFLLNALVEAGHHFENGDLEKFDALVGENACQIRAIKIAILASKNTINFKDLITKASILQHKLSTILEESNLARLMIKDVTLDGTIDAEKLDIELTYEQLFLFHSFLLCEMKEPTFDGDYLPELIVIDKSAAKKLKRFHHEVSTNFIGFTLARTRKLVAEHSVNFVRRSALDLNDPHIIKMTSHDFTVEHNNLPCIPMFWGYKALIDAAKKESIPLVAHIQFVIEQEVGYKVIEEEFVFFKPSQDEHGFKYIQTSQEMIESKTPACVLQGVVLVDAQSENFDKTAWHERMKKYSIIDIILAVAADHRQYPAVNSNITVSDQDFEHYRSIAKNNGFSMGNPNTFFINHVFPMQVGRALNLSKIS